MMVFSVYDYVKKNYTYYQGTGIPPAAGTFRMPAPNASPESLAVKLPPGAKKIGEGPKAKGVLAVGDARALSAYGTDVLSSMSPWIYAGVGLLSGWFWGRRK